MLAAAAEGSSRRQQQKAAAEGSSRLVSSSSRCEHDELLHCSGAGWSSAGLAEDESSAGGKDGKDEE
jgi:hypothetical protein